MGLNLFIRSSDHQPDVIAEQSKEKTRSFPPTKQEQTTKQQQKKFTKENSTYPEGKHEIQNLKYQEDNGQSHQNKFSKDREYQKYQKRNRFKIL